MTTTDDTHAKEFAYWTTGWNYWQARQRGEKVKMYNDAPCCGFYRKRDMIERAVPGKKAVYEFHPVAIFMAGDTMIGRVGNADTGRDVSGDALNELWTWVGDKDVSQEAYDAVARRGEPWPDAHDPSKNKPARARAESSNVHVQAALVEGEAPSMIDEDEPAPEIVLKRDIEAGLAGVSQYVAIDSDDASARAQSLRSTLAALGGRADKIREAEKQPFLEACRLVDAKYQPLIKAAAGGVTSLRGYMAAWEDTKRIAAREAQRKADEEAAAHARKVREAEAANAPPPPPPEPVKRNMPEPVAQIKGATGRAAAVRLQKFVTEIDAAEVFKSFAKNDEVIALLTALSQKAIRAGVDIPGAKWEERSVV